MAGFIRAPRVRGAVPLRSVDGAALLAHIAADFRARECQVRVDGNTLVLERGAPGRYSPLSFVDNGTVVLDRDVLRYDMSTDGGLLLCLVLSAVAGPLAWFTLGDTILTVFAVLAPLLWLYGANYVTARVRVHSLLQKLCRTVPTSAER